MSDDITDGVFSGKMIVLSCDCCPPNVCLASPGEVFETSPVCDAVTTSLCAFISAGSVGFLDPSICSITTVLGETAD